jgi:serine/threonine protein kinase
VEDSQDSTISMNSSSEREQALAPGAIVDDKYQIVSLIGKGGMGSVYRVHQIFLGKDFALKVLDLHQRTEVTERRFKQEARTASQLQHPNLVGVHGFGVLGGVQPYLVMDFIEGLTLAEVLKKKETLPVDYVVRLALQLSFGLLYAHDKGVVHRDIKPGNIMLLHPDRDPAEGAVKIVDFGIAKLTQGEEGEIQSLTRTGEVFGSPVYMSPEQCKGAAVDRRSDIYSLGCVLYECLTGVPPFLGETAMSTMMKRLSEKPTSLREATLGREFPELLEHIIQKMLATEPEDRYQELHSLVNDLIALQRPEVGIVVTAANKKPEFKKDFAVSQKVLLTIGTLIVSVAATAIFDRAFVYPRYFAPAEIQTNKIAYVPEGIFANWKDKKPSNSDAKTLNAARSSPAPETEKFGTNPHDNTPSVSIEEGSSGKKQVLFFPDSYGTIIVGGKKYEAKGKIAVPLDASVTYRLNSSACANDKALQNLTGVRFHRIDFNSIRSINDRYISVLARMPFLEQVGLEFTNVASLEPLYNSKTITYLEVGNTNVPASEILKVKRLKKLRLLSFGPIPDAYRVIDGLAQSDSIDTVIYKGVRLLEDHQGHGLTRRDVTSLARLVNLRHLTVDSSPQFDNASLEKLLTLKNLSSLRIVDCGLTPQCISTLAKFKNLKFLSLTTPGWPESDLSSLRKRFNLELRKTHSQVRAEHNSDVDAVQSILDKSESFAH